MDIAEAKPYLGKSLDALKAYREAFFYHRDELICKPYWLVISLNRWNEAGTQFLITAWWYDSAIAEENPPLWDYLLLDVAQRDGQDEEPIDLAFQELCSGDERIRSRFEPIDSIEGEKPVQTLEQKKEYELEVLGPLLNRFEPLPSLKYHPLRFRKMSSLAPLIKEVVEAQLETFYHQNILDSIHAAQVDIANFGPAPLRDRRCCANPRDLTYGMTGVAVAAGDHAIRGNAVYEFPLELINRFKRTDVSKVPLSAICLPYASQFVYFTPQPEYELWPGWYLDGAYVSEVMGNWNIVFTAAAPSFDEYYRACLCGEPSEHLAFGKDQRLKLLCAEAVEQIIAKRSAQYREEAEGTALDEYGRRNREVIDQKVAEIGVDKVQNVQARNALIQLERLPHSRQIWDGALKLLLNALMYLTHYPDDSDRVWSSGTPKLLLHKLRQGTQQERAKARRGLAASGHTQIILTGRRLREQLQRASGTSTVTGESTYVSGHWRRFAVGRGRIERRWQWLMPYIRNEKAGATPRSHIYMVDPDPTLQ